MGSGMKFTTMTLSRCDGIHRACMQGYEVINYPPHRGAPFLFLELLFAP